VLVFFGSQKASIHRTLNMHLPHWTTSAYEGCRAESWMLFAIAFAAKG